jgi:hypothetical protein
MNRAPWPLQSYAQLTEPFGVTTKLKWQRMAEVIEPPALPHMPPATWPQLTESERTTLRSWFAACAPPVAEHSGCDLEDGGTFTGFDLAASAGR